MRLYEGGGHLRHGEECPVELEAEMGAVQRPVSGHRDGLEPTEARRGEEVFSREPPGGLSPADNSRCTLALRASREKVSVF